MKFILIKPSFFNLRLLLVCFVSVLFANPQNEPVIEVEAQDTDEATLPTITVVATKPKKVASPFLGVATQNATVHEPFQRRIFDLDNKHKNTTITVDNDTLGINLDEETGLVYFTPDNESQIGTHNIQFTVKKQGQTFHHNVDFIVSEPNK